MKNAPKSVDDLVVEKPPFGVNEMRLSWRLWIFVVVLVTMVISITPSIWKRIEKFDTGPDYRLPYELSKDYWLYQTHLQKADGDNKIFVLGDSVVWGEYVNRDGTLSHFLQEASTNKLNGDDLEFVNAGINGLFPLALEGLARNYGSTFQDRKILLHCNLLWLSSPKADLQTTREEKFNHVLLVPQFNPRIPSYKASFDDRTAHVIQRNSDFLSWGNHLKYSYFSGFDLLTWSLLENNAGRFTNAARNPLSSIHFVVPGEPSPDLLRGPTSPRHKPWTTREGPGTEIFEWVTLESSLQWAAFQRLVRYLQQQGNSVFVVVGPLNEHMMTPDNQKVFEGLKGGVAGWLKQENIPHLVPEVLPSRLYADTSHPITEGYRLMAESLLQSQAFSEWMTREP